MDCFYDASRDVATLTQDSYSAFSYRLTQKADQARLPIAGSLELNLRCNLRCKHCYVSHGHGGIPGEVELSRAEIERLLGELAEAGTLWLLLTGGEPLLRRDFPEIYLAARRQGMLLTVFTNGTLITPRKADFFAEWRPFSLEISL
ncbi:MAG: radical SAM protein, partial [Anaerolineales bacterium]|nr:radical SAM protein [Anaerolineales bacterium]